MQPPFLCGPLNRHGRTASAPSISRRRRSAGSVFDVRDGITVESNTGTTDELVKGLDALDKAMDTHADQVGREIPPPSGARHRALCGREERAIAPSRGWRATAKEAAAKRERDAATAENARPEGRAGDAGCAATVAPAARDAAGARHQTEPEPDPNSYPAGEFDPRYCATSAATRPARVSPATRRRTAGQSRRDPCAGRQAA